MIIITGKNGYIATHLYNYLIKSDRSARLVSLRNGIKADIFSDADTVIHTAGIVHKKAKSVEYQKVNTELTIKIAKAAKNSGVKQFIFFSTMSVYGKNTGKIDDNTPTAPVNDYGRSKLAAEKEILKLNDENFCVTVVRPPMVYGKNCPGNYAKLSSFIKKTPVFPYSVNKRSMIYIENLCACIKTIIDKEMQGIFHVQNSEYTDTCKMCALIADANSHKVHFSKLLGVVGFLPIGVISKIFGSLYYDKSIAFENDVVDFESSIKLTEKF